MTALVLFLSSANAIAQTNTGEVGGVVKDISGGVLAVSGANQTSPIDASGGENNGPYASISVTAPSITTTLPNALLVYGGACNGVYTFTPPTLMTEQWDRATGSSTSRVATEVATAPFPTPGPTGTRTATASGSCRSVAVQIAIPA